MTRLSGRRARRWRHHLGDCLRPARWRSRRLQSARPHGAAAATGAAAAARRSTRRHQSQTGPPQPAAASPVRPGVPDDPGPRVYQSQLKQANAYSAAALACMSAASSSSTLSGIVAHCADISHTHGRARHATSMQAATGRHPVEEAAQGPEAQVYVRLGVEQPRHLAPPSHAAAPHADQLSALFHAGGACRCFQ